jgi:hypothetical protein
MIWIGPALVMLGLGMVWLGMHKERASWLADDTTIWETILLWSGSLSVAVGLMIMLVVFAWQGH